MIAAAGVWMAASAVVAPPPAAASRLSAALGCDYYEGGDDHLARGATAAVGFGLGSQSDGFVAAGVFDDNLAGEGMSLMVGSSVGVRGSLRLRVSGAHIRAENDLRAMRYEFGPQFRLPTGRTLSLLFVRYDDNGDVTSNGLRTEAGAPLVPRLAARLNGAWASTNAGVATIEGSVGLVWTVIDHFEVAADLGVAQNGGGAPGRPTPITRGLGGLPILEPPAGEPASTTNRDEIAPTFLLGVRLLVP